MFSQLLAFTQLREFEAVLAASKGLWKATKEGFWLDPLDPQALTGSS